MPMVTLFKTLDVTRLVHLGYRHGCKFNMLMCWCIGKAASQIGEFFLLPVYAVIGAVYAAPGNEQGAGNVVRAVERTR